MCERKLRLMQRWIETDLEPRLTIDMTYILKYKDLFAILPLILIK